MRHRRQDGFILILVVALIPLIGIISATLAVNSRSLLVRVRMQAVEQRARCAVDSGQAWATTHAAQVAALETGRPIVLTMDTDPGASCRIALVSRGPAGTVVEITGSAADRRFTASRQKTVTIGFP